MIFVSHSFNNADNAIDNQIIASVEDSIEESSFKFQTGNSKKLRRIILDELSRHGWSDKVAIDDSSNITITSHNSYFGLCLQTGNMSRFYADILKLEYLFKKEKIKAGIYIIPTREAAKILGSNIANFERFTHELEIFSDILSIPLKVYGLKSE